MNPRDHPHGGGHPPDEQGLNVQPGVRFAHVTPDEVADPLPVAFWEGTVQLQLVSARLDDVGRYRWVAAVQVAQRISGVRHHREHQHRRQQQDRDQGQKATDDEERHWNSSVTSSEGAAAAQGTRKTN